MAIHVPATGHQPAPKAFRATIADAKLDVVYEPGNLDVSRDVIRVTLTFDGPLPDPEELRDRHVLVADEHVRPVRFWPGSPGWQNCTIVAGSIDDGGAGITLTLRHENGEASQHQFVYVPGNGVLNDYVLRLRVKGSLLIPSSLIDRKVFVLFGKDGVLDLWPIDRSAEALAS